MPKDPRPGVRPVYVELEEKLVERLAELARVNRRTLKDEMTLALERHVESAVEGGQDQAVAAAPQETADDEGPPTTRGRYLIFVGAPVIRDGPRWVHFSWRGESFCVRDFLRGGIRRDDPGLKSADVWKAALKRKPATGEYFHPVGEWAWWKGKLEELTRAEPG